jgi:hypothetical protein
MIMTAYESGKQIPNTREISVDLAYSHPMSKDLPALALARGNTKYPLVTIASLRHQCCPTNSLRQIFL